MKFSGITRRWYINVLAVIFVFLVGFVAVFSTIIYNFYYDSVKQQLKSSADVTAAFFNKYSKIKYSEFYTGARQLVDDFSQKDKMELQIVDLDGKILFSTNGFVPKDAIKTRDFTNAVWGQSSSFIGKNSETGENIMAVSSALKDSYGNIRGVARIVVSLTELNSYIFLIIVISAIVAIIILILVIFSGGYFINSIVRPLGEITTTAKDIAKGDLSVRIDKKYDDEIGVLVDSINNMADELSKTEHVKNDFISSVSHELRTPLTAIRGWSETMLSCDLNQEADTVNKGLNIINDEAKRLTTMVEELLDFSRMQNNGLKINLEPIDVGHILMECIFIMKERARREGIIIEFSVTDELPPMMGDDDRLKQVFINIIDNAVKHSESEGNIDVTATFDENILITITDYGCGIPAEFLPKIKGKFIKGQSLKRGSGLGLAIADEIVALHQGELTIESEEGKGTKVIVILPIIKLEQSENEGNV